MEIGYISEMAVNEAIYSDKFRPRQWIVYCLFLSS